MAFIAGMPLLGVAAVAVWLGDFVGRLLRMEWGSRDEGGVDDVAEPDQGPPRQPPAR
jgi:hypothetical protein